MSEQLLRAPWRSRRIHVCLSAVEAVGDLHGWQWPSPHFSAGKHMCTRSGLAPRHVGGYKPTMKPRRHSRFLGEDSGLCDGSVFHVQVCCVLPVARRSSVPIPFPARIRHRFPFTSGSGTEWSVSSPRSCGVYVSYRVQVNCFLFCILLEF